MIIRFRQLFFRCGIITAIFLTIIPVTLKSQPSVVVVSAASYQSAVAPDSLASLFGTNLAGKTTSAELDSNGNLPGELAGISVKVNGRNAGLLFVSPGQINFLVPPQTETGEAQVVVKRSDDTILGTGTADIRRTVPALFSLDATGHGPGAILNAVTYKLEPFMVETTENHGADKQTRLALYGTGLRLAGEPNKAPATGNVAAYVKAQVISEDGPTDLPVEYAGVAPGYFGLDQVNVVLPKSLDGAGILTVTITVGDQISNPVTIEVWSVQKPQIKSFSPAALPPGAPLTITGTSFAKGLPRSRNRILFDAGNGLSAAVLPLEGDSTTLRTFVPALTKDPQKDPESEWYKGPVTLCVETDGHRTCAQQPLVIQAPVTVSGNPGDLLIRFVEQSNGAVLGSIQALETAQQVNDFQQMSAQALKDLRQKIADAQAGNPHKTTITLEDGQTVTAVFDLAAIRKLEALLAAGEPSFDAIVHSMEKHAQDMERRAASASRNIDWSVENHLMELKTLHQNLDKIGRAITISQFSIAGAALAGCLAFPPSCPVLAGAVSTVSPFFAAANLLQVAGVVQIELGPNSLESLSTVPSNRVEVPVWSTQALSVNGRFVSSMDPGLAMKEVAKRVISRWIGGAFGLGFATSYIFEKTLSPVIGLTADALLDLGLRDHIRIKGGSSQNVQLSWNTVWSNCIHGSSPSPGVPFFVEGDWTIDGFEGMSSAERCEFFPSDDHLLRLHDSTPPALLLVRVTQSEPSTCRLFPNDKLVPFESVYYVSDPSANGDRLVVGATSRQRWSPFTVDVGGRSVSLPLPRFANERYCSPVQLAPGCTADAYVPTQEERNGDFSAFGGALYDPLTAHPGPNGGTIMLPFPMNTIPQSRQGPGGTAAWRVRSVQGCGGQ